MVGLLIERRTYMGPTPATILVETLDFLILNTTDETDIVNYEVPNLVLDGSRGVEAIFDYSVLNGTGADSDITWRVYCGATLMWESLDTIAAGAQKVGMFGAALHAKQTTTAQELYGQILQGDAGTPGAGEGELGGTSSIMPFFGESAEDNDEPLPFRVSIEFETADPDIHITRRKLHLLNL